MFIPQLLEIYMQGRFPFDQLVQFYDFDQMNQVAADTESGATVKADPAHRLKHRRSANEQFVA